MALRNTISQRISRKISKSELVQKGKQLIKCEKKISKDYKGDEAENKVLFLLRRLNYSQDIIFFIITATTFS